MRINNLTITRLNSQFPLDKNPRVEITASKNLGDDNTISLSIEGREKDLPSLINSGFNDLVIGNPYDLSISSPDDFVGQKKFKVISLEMNDSEDGEKLAHIYINLAHIKQKGLFNKKELVSKAEIYITNLSKKVTLPSINEEVVLLWTPS